ncbi:MAG: hypothetical protein E7551_04295 [Ruminococcaceae bacterium]|nr:hypothetical protein [Oscillospiraceae bacterium]
MKTLKKALSIVLGLAIMLSCVMGMQVSVAAEETTAEGTTAEGTTLDISVGDAVAADGTVTVPVSIDANPGFRALGIEVSYDANVLELTNAAKTTLVADIDEVGAKSETLDTNPYVMMWAYVTDENVTATGTIANLTFNVLDDSADTTVSVEVTEAWDASKAAVATTTTEGTVKFCEYVDANQDGRCDNCGEENLDEDLAFYGKAMVLGADIRGIFQVRKIKATSPYESFKVLVEKGSVESELELVATSDKTNHTTYGYAITVAAKEMADDLNARIVGITAEGEAFTSNVDTWSIKTGAVSLLDAYTAKTDADSQNRAKMLANMLNYGAEAQKHFEYNLENLATNGLKDEYTALIITEEPEMEVIAKPDETGITATLKSISLNLDAKAEILPIFKVAKSDVKESYSAEVTQTHTAPNGTVMEKSFTIAGADCLKSGTSFGVYINNLESDEMRDILTVTLYKDGVQVSATHTFSSASAIKGDLYLRNPDLANALMVYGDCAYAVFGNNALTQ